MDLLSPLRFGLQVTTDVVKLATLVPRLILHQLDGDHGDVRAPARARPTAAPSPRPTPGRATSPDGAVQVTSSPPEPTSAAGASGGVAGTAAKPGDAALASAPDPTAASSVRPRRPAPQGERRTADVRPTRARRRQATTPSRAEVDRRREQAREREAAPPEVVETEGSATPSATITVDEPWTGYDKMRAPEIVARLKESDDATKAVVRLYEQTTKKRKTILSATSG